MVITDIDNLRITLSKSLGNQGHVDSISEFQDNNKKGLLVIIDQIKSNNTIILMKLLKQLKVLYNIHKMSYLSMEPSIDTNNNYKLNIKIHLNNDRH